MSRPRVYAVIKKFARYQSDAMSSYECRRISRCRTLILSGMLTAIFLFPVIFHGKMKSAHGSTAKGGTPMVMQLTSPAFSPNGSIPAVYTCDGRNISPPLVWNSLPAGTRSLVLIVEDPDAPDPRAPRMTWVHWVLYNIPAAAAELPENTGAGGLPAGTLAGLNNWGRPDYGGPCPPIGRHRYFFKLYALDFILPDLNRPKKEKLRQAIQGHILDQTELIGTFQR